VERTDRRARGTPVSEAMNTMDLWYDLAMREPAHLNEEAGELLRDAEEVLGPSAAEEAKEDDE
jgi:hypothetical protein